MKDLISYSNLHHYYTSFTIVCLQSFYYLKIPAKQNFKLKPCSPIFNVRFYCNDGRFYYMSAGLAIIAAIVRQLY